MRPLASVIEIGTDTLEYVTDNDQAGWGWVGETQARPDTYTPQLGKLAITVRRDVRHAERQPEDARRRLRGRRGWLAGKVSEVFARGEATAFISGNGINKPTGYPDLPGRAPRRLRARSSRSTRATPTASPTWA